MRFLGLDFGSRTVGVAVSDPTGMLAYGIEIIRRERENHLRKTLTRIGGLIREYDAGALVLGYPLNMDDRVGERAEKTLAFKAELEKKFALPVYLVDERLTTVEAYNIMDDLRMGRKERKELVDALAAELILQEFLNETGSRTFS